LYIYFHRSGDFDHLNFPKMKKCIFQLMCYSFCFSVYAQETKPSIGTIEFVSDELSMLIKKDAALEIMAEGFQWSEGPVWLNKQQMLLFSDVPTNTIYKWTASGGKEIYLKPSGYTGKESRSGFMGSNGLALGVDGRLLLCQHGDRRIARMNAPVNKPSPDFITIAAAYNGKKINSPNDLAVKAGGDIYFTDPSYGFEKGMTDPKKEIPYQGVYKVDAGGQVSLLIDSIEQPNGIGIFPDGKTLLVSNSDEVKKRWYAYDITPSGPLTNARVFYDVGDEKGPGGCDGLKIDNNGNVFATGPGGIWIFTKNGKLIGKIKLNGVPASNCALTTDGKTIFITASKYLLRLKMR
jgi:gluconolactonase